MTAYQTHKQRTQMAISIGQMNQYLKNYTESLLKCYGIPVEGKKVVDEETYQEQYTALKSLETAMWKLTEANDVLHAEILKLERDAHYEATEGKKEMTRHVYQETCDEFQDKIAELEGEIDHKDITISKLECENKNLQIRLRASEKRGDDFEANYWKEAHRAALERTQSAGAGYVIKALRDHIADCRGDANERAQAYEDILEKADRCLKRNYTNIRPKKFNRDSPYNTEEENSDEETDEETDEE